MSLDVTLIDDDATEEEERWAIFIRENGQTKEISREEWDRRNPGTEPGMCKVGGKRNVVYSANITHNLNEMAKECKLYMPLWRPDEIGIEKANDLIPLLVDGFQNLCMHPMQLQQYNPKNGWGNYELLVEFTADYIVACVKNPSARIEVSR